MGAAGELRVKGGRRTRWMPCRTPPTKGKWKRVRCLQPRERERERERG
ncbi:unnamed protein product [Musa hybrid cultivar]